MPHLEDVMHFRLNEGSLLEDVQKRISCWTVLKNRLTSTEFQFSVYKLASGWLREAKSFVNRYLGSEERFAVVKKMVLAKKDLGKAELGITELFEYLEYPEDKAIQWGGLLTQYVQRQEAARLFEGRITALEVAQYGNNLVNKGLRALLVARILAA